MMWLYLLIVILRSQKVINDGHPLSQLLTKCIQKAVCVFWTGWFGEGVTPLATAMGWRTGWIVNGLWWWWWGTIQADIGIGLPTGLACQPWWVELGWRGAGERLWPRCRRWGTLSVTWDKEATYTVILMTDKCLKEHVKCNASQKEISRYWL